MYRRYYCPDVPNHFTLTMAGNVDIHTDPQSTLKGFCSIVY